MALIKQISCGFRGFTSSARENPDYRCDEPRKRSASLRTLTTLAGTPKITA